jgi:hypothetical protein
MRRLRGLVVDHEGHGIPAAIALVRGKSQELQASQLSDGGGLFTIPALFTDEVSVRVAKAGYVPIERIVATQLSDAEDPVRFVIEEGRVVRATAEDAEGHAVAIDALRAEGANIPNIPATLEGNVWLLKDLPAGEIALVLTAEGRAWRRTNDAREPAVKFILPVAGSVVVRLTKTVGVSAYVRATLDANENALLDSGASGAQIAAGRTELRFGAVAPGRYTLRVQTIAMGGFELDPADAGDTNKTIEVKSGETTTVTWDGTLRLATRVRPRPTQRNAPSRGSRRSPWPRPWRPR